MTLLAGCGFVDGMMDKASNPTPKADSAESLLAAEGSWNMVQEEAPDSPAAQHAQAKTKVDPITSKQIATYKPKFRQEPDENPDMQFRLLRMEREVADLRSDFKKLLPPLSSLLTSDKKLDETIAEIESKNAIEPSSGAMAVQSQPERTAAVKKPVSVVPKKPALVAAPTKDAPLSALGPLTINALRTGEHPGKTRLVLDANRQVKMSYDLDNNERILIVSLADAQWATTMQRAVRSSPVVAGYSVQKGPNGETLLVIELKKAAKITMAETLGPNAAAGKPHRAVLDIAAL